MKNAIEKILNKHQLPCLTVYQTPTNTIQISTSGYNEDTYKMMVIMLTHDEELYDFLEQALEAAYLLKNPSP